MSKRTIVSSGRGARRVFAAKARPSIGALKNRLFLRGGGYL